MKQDFFFKGTHRDGKKKSAITYLCYEGANDNYEENRVCVDVREDVAFAVHFARVDFIENLHEYKGIEDEGKMMGGGARGPFSRAVIYVE